MEHFRVFFSNDCGTCLSNNCGTFLSNNCGKVLNFFNLNFWVSNIFRRLCFEILSAKEFLKKNTYGKETFLVKLHVNSLQIYQKYHSSTSVKRNYLLGFSIRWPLDRKGLTTFQFFKQALDVDIDVLCRQFRYIE